MEETILNSENQEEIRENAPVAEAAAEAIETTETRTEAPVAEGENNENTSKPAAAD